MFSATLGELAALADRRFVRSALVPSLVFCSLSALILTTGRGSAREALFAWHHGSWESKVLVVAGFVLAVLCVAVALGNAQMGLLRLAEGYWGTVAGRTLGQLGRRHHQRFVRRSDEAFTHDRYPPRTRPHEIMPTRLGNILKAAELYPRLRYGIDTVLVWPRLHPLLPETFLTTLGAARTGLTAMLGSALLAVVLGLGGAGYLWAVHASTSLPLLCLWGGSLVAWICYRAALLRAMIYGQHLRVAFDLYRRHLLEALDHPCGDAEDERAHWERLCLFWHRGILPQHGARPEQPVPRPMPSPDGRPRSFSPSLSHVAAALLTTVGVAGAFLGAR